MAQPRVLVLGIGGPAGYNFAECIKEDYEVIGADCNRFHIKGLPDEFRDRTFLLPRVDEPEYLAELLRICKTQKIDMVHAQSDVEVAYLSSLRKVFADYNLFLPDAQSLGACSDKLETAMFLKELAPDISPRSYPAGNYTQIRDALFEENFADSGHTFTTHVWVRARKGAGSRAALKAHTASQIIAWSDYWQDYKHMSASDFMISEYLPGREFAWQSLWHEGRLVAAGGRERLEYVFGHLTVTGQSSSPSVARSVQDERVHTSGIRAVCAVSERPHGVFCVDMKENREGCLKVTEVNAGRFFTTSNYFAQIGSNMPRMYVDLALGKEVLSQDIFTSVKENTYWIRQIDTGTRLHDDTFSPL